MRYVTTGSREAISSVPSAAALTRRSVRLRRERRPSPHPSTHIEVRVMKLFRILSSLLVAIGLLFSSRLATAQQAPAKDASVQPQQRLPYTPVVTPNGTTLPWTMKDGV